MPSAVDNVIAAWFLKNLSYSALFSYMIDNQKDREKRSMKHRYHFKRSIRVGIVLLLACPLYTWADNNWTYQQKSDSLNNQTYSTALSPLPRPGLYDDMTLEIVCKDHKLQAVINADDLIASQNSEFKIEYQIDKNPAVKLSMKTFPDSKRRGFTETEAKHIADDLLTGQAVFIRINTMIRTVLSSSIPLDNIAEPINQVLKDCGFTAPTKSTAELPYDLTTFEQAFNQLSSEQKQNVLIKIKDIMKTSH